MKYMGAASARNSRLDLEPIAIENRALFSKSKAEKPKFDTKRLNREKLLKDAELNKQAARLFQTEIKHSN